MLHQCRCEDGSYREIGEDRRNGELAVYVQYTSPRRTVPIARPSGYLATRFEPLRQKAFLRAFASSSSSYAEYVRDACPPEDMILVANGFLQNV